MTKTVFTAIVGRPNVGKSSLLNRLVGEKVAIVTHKPQTTRTRITGILTKGETQFVFLDTPGMHAPKTRLGERMARTVRESVTDTDAALMLFEPAGRFNEAELKLAQSIKESGVFAMAAINKVDMVAVKEHLLERIAAIDSLGVFSHIVPISAADGTGVADVLRLLEGAAAPGPHYFPDDHYTDLPEKQLVAEIVREKILENMQDEIPHGTAVVVERFHERDDKPIVDIDANIYCEKKSHKGMLIGKNGQMLKKIASAAREDCERLLQCKVNLQCWVKVKEDWRDSEGLLNMLGFRPPK